MGRKILLFSLAIGVMIVPSALFAGWMRTYGGGGREWGACVNQTADSGYIALGTTETFGIEGKDIWLLKLDEYGDTIWTQVFADSGANYGNCVCQTDDGGYIIASTRRLIKTDSDGNLQWTRPYSASYVDLTDDEGYILASTRDDNVCLIRMDQSGDTIWTREYEGDFPSWGNCVRQDSDGGYLVAGTQIEVGALSPYLRQYAWFFRTDADGEMLNQGMTFEGEGWTSGRTICPAPVGDFFFGGVQVWDGATVQYLLLGKSDSWVYSLWGNEVEGVAANSVESTLDEGCIVAGSGWTLFKADDSGEIAWSKDYGFAGNCVDITSDSGFIVVGTKNDDLCLLKTDSLGDTLTGIQEPHFDVESSWDIVGSIGSEIVLRYSDCPRGFHAQVFDATGRKVDEIHSADASGTIIWPVTHQSPGVYFIKQVNQTVPLAKAVLIR